MNEFNEIDFSEKINVGLWKRIVKYAFMFKESLIAIVVTMILVAVCDVITPLLTRYAIDHFVVQGTLQGIGLFAGLYFVIICLQCFCTWQFVKAGGWLESSMATKIRDDSFLNLQKLSFSYYDRTPVGYILARTVSDIMSISEIVSWSIVDIAWAFVYVLGCFGVMFSLNWKLTLIVMCVIPVLLVVSIYFQRMILKCQRLVRKINSKITGSYNEEVMGAQTTKTLVREEENFKEFSELTERMRKSSIRSAVMSHTLMPLVMFIGSVATALAIVFGGRMTTAGLISLGTLAAFISYTTQLFDPIQSIARILAEYQSAQASAERVMDLIDTKPDIVETPEVVEKYGDNFEPKTENWPPIKGGIEFRNVSFRYNEKESVLEDFNLKVEPGQTIALVGETGAGKSTIVNLVCRFYEPTEGQILVDGVDYRERSSLWLEKSLGYVLQSPHLFSGTIEDNIRFARPEASHEEVVNAAKMVSADSFITALKDGYNTEVGEGGVLLSTGQKQLISFARVILADPRIFVLDEATSSVDTETEKLIQNAITKILNGRTSFIVAHRLSTIRDADRILVIRDGRITEDGTHKELMALRGYYYNLYTNQFREEKGAEVLGR